MASTSEHQRSRSARVRSLLSREGQIVLRANPFGTQADYAQFLHGPVEWKRLLSLAEHERATLPLWRVIRNSPLAAGGDGAKALRALAQVWEFKLFHLERMFEEAIAAFAHEGLTVLLLKGAAAAVSVYGGFSRRPMVDVDLLVEEGRGETAWVLAQEIGWNWDPRRHPRESYSNAHHLPPLYDSFGASCGMEIHTRLWMPDSPFSFGETDLWERSIEVEVKGTRCRVPCVADQLLHTCIHFAWSHRLKSHGWRAFSDVAAYLRSGEIGWDDFVSRAHSAGADSCAYWTLRLARSVCDAPVPAEVLESLRPAGSSRLLDLLERQYVTNLLPDERGTPSLALARRLWRMGIQRGPGSNGIDLPDDPKPMLLRERVRHHVKQLPQWWEYVRRVVQVDSAPE
ncbi:MAG TPA: nucleotidyltransferase family protein [Longimicrobiaceae bacterium]